MNSLLQAAYIVFIAISLVTAFWMIRKYQRSTSIMYLAGIIFGFTIMMIAQVVLFSTSSNSTALLFDRIGFVGGIWTFSMILMFSLFFPFPSKQVPKNNYLLWLLPNVFFLPYILLNPSFLNSVKLVSGGVKETYGASFWIFPIVVFLYFLSSVILLLKKIPLAQGVSRSSISLFVFTLFLVCGLAVYSDVIRPALGYSRLPISGIYALLLFSVSTYVLARK